MNTMQQKNGTCTGKPVWAWVIAVVLAGCASSPAATPEPDAEPPVPYLGERVTITGQVYDRATGKPLMDLNLPVYMFFSPEALDQAMHGAPPVDAYHFEGAITNGQLSITLGPVPENMLYGIANEITALSQGGNSSVEPADAQSTLCSLDLLNGGLLQYISLEHEATETAYAFYSYCSKDTVIQFTGETHPSANPGITLQWLYGTDERKGWNYQIRIFKKVDAHTRAVVVKNEVPGPYFRWYYTPPAEDSASKDPPAQAVPQTK